MPRLHRLLVALAVSMTGVAAVPAWAAGPDLAAARRFLTLIGGAVTEYQEAIDDAGKIVRPLEIEEASLLLAEARDLVPKLGAAVPADLPARVERLEAGITGGGPLAELTGLADAIKSSVREATGVHEEVLPPLPPSVTRGKVVYEDTCARCHGDTGAGDGPDAVILDRKPANFTDLTFMRAETPTDFFHVVSLGRRRSGMPAWEEVLSVQQRWDAVAYVWSLARTPAALAEGQGTYLSQCASCHGVTGDGRGTWSAGLLTPVPELSTVAVMGLKADADLYAAVTDGVPGTAMPSFGRLLTDAERWKAVVYLRALSLGGGPADRQRAAATAGAEPTTGGAHATLDAVERQVMDAIAAYRRGDAEAPALATDAYATFEPLEKELGAKDAAVVLRVEEGFVRLRGTLRETGRGDDLERLGGEVSLALAAARAVLTSRTDRWALLGQSVTIIFREGFEIVLVVGALLAYVRRGGAPALVRAIYAGSAVGIVASLATAGLLVTVFRMTPGLGALLEGAAMLLASVVLFWVSYWIISKAEADRWQRYIQGKVKKAMAAGSGAALAGAAFLAVYREGFETVLFYQALIATAPAGGTSMVWAGMALGAVLLAAVYATFARLEVRLPIRPFFLVTGGLLYLMAVIFAGRGVFELQEAGVVPFTLLPWAPRVEWLGVFPSLETLAAQGVLLVLALIGGMITWRRVQRARAAAESERSSDPVSDVHAVGRRRHA